MILSIDIDAESPSYKQAHESFVTGFSGSNIFEISLLFSVLPASALLHRVLVASFWPQSELEQSPAKSRFGIVRLAVDFATIAVPVLLAFTVLADHCLSLVASLLAAALLLHVLHGSTTAGRQNSSRTPLLGVNELSVQRLSAGGRKPFVSECRAAMLLSTFVAILAVDFPVFPRRFAKCETYGISLMDVGVGMFLLANALTSKPARAASSRSRLQLLLSTLKAVSPLLLIGVVRMLTVKAADYQEHVSEYGVHWNFFVTLAAVALLVSALDVPSRLAAPAGLVLLIGYQLALSRLGVADYIEHAPRTTLFGQNREGIYSSIGYAALFLIGTQLGQWLLLSAPVLPPDANRNMISKAAREWRRRLLVMAAGALLAFVLGHYADLYVQPYSRRMVNLSYALAALGLHLQATAAQLAVGLCTPPVTNVVLEAINANGLAIFLLANICTGLVNLSMRTIFAPHSVALAVLLAYLAFVSLVAVALWRFRISLKLW